MARQWNVVREVKIADGGRCAMLSRLPTTFHFGIDSDDCESMEPNTASSDLRVAIYLPSGDDTLP